MCWPVCVTAPSQALGAQWWTWSSPRWVLQGWGCSGFPWTSELLHMVGALLLLCLSCSQRSGARRKLHNPQAAVGLLRWVLIAVLSSHDKELRNYSGNQISTHPVLKPSRLFFFPSHFQVQIPNSQGLNITAVSDPPPLPGARAG